jgi:hypothetical protein
MTLAFIKQIKEMQVHAQKLLPESPGRHMRIAASPSSESLQQAASSHSPMRRSKWVAPRGLENEQAARDVQALLRRFEIVSMAGDAIAVASARNFRSGPGASKTAHRYSTTIAIFIQWPAMTAQLNYKKLASPGYS